MSGAGETNLEIERRTISDKEKLIKKELALIEKRRDVSNANSIYKIVSFVGYTNVS
jgi:50S ribosomal subunit-associated GTPase HflX